MPYFTLQLTPSGGSAPDPSKEVAAEILLRHRNDREPWLHRLLSTLARKLTRWIPPHQEPPRWPLAGVRQPLGRGPRPRSGAVALKEPW